MSAPHDQSSDDEMAAIVQQPLGSRLAAYTKRSGPGWLQGAITLGGGSLAGALYLGVISGYGLMWLQPLAMICGIIMLSAISYVTLSTGQRPFRLVNEHLSPALGWAWLIATVMANIVWCMPQFALGTAAIQQNLFSSDIPIAAIVAVLLIIAFFVNYLYESGGGGAKLFDLIIKVMVGIIVVSFFAVVVTLSNSGVIDWGEIFTGLIPNPSLLFNPAPAYAELIASSSDPGWWTAKIASDQQDIIIAAFGTAVGINMTWLLPYSLLKKKWGKNHRGLSIFDLSIGLFIPFFVATSCVVIAAASQFHTKTDDILKEGAEPPAAVVKTLGELENPNDTDTKLAAMLVKRDAFQLATTLEPLAGKTVSQKIFGIGVLGMALSTIIILMLMNGTAFQELAGGGDSKLAYFIGCAISGFSGAAGPYLWGNANAKMALAVPTSVIGGSLIPIAYFTFLLLMNSKPILGDSMPTGGRRFLWNTLMVTATGIATFGSVWVLKGKSAAPGFPGAAATAGLVILGLLFVLGIIGFISKHRSHSI